MTVHEAAEDERARVRLLERHEERVRAIERARVLSNLTALLQNPDPVPCDFFGCTT